MGFQGGASGKECVCQYSRHKSLGFDPWVGKIPLEEEMATHSSILAWRLPWVEETGETSYFYLLINLYCPILNIHLRLLVLRAEVLFPNYYFILPIIIFTEKNTEGFTVTGRKEYFSLLPLVWDTRYSEANLATICFDNIQQNKKGMHYWACTEILAEEISKQGGVGRGGEELRTEQG